MIDPFEEVEPAEPLDAQQVLMTQLARSMMWDMIGPYKMRDEPTKYMQNPASTDVLEAESQEFWHRKHLLGPFGMDFPMLCFVASQTASSALLLGEGLQDKLTPEEQMKFRVSNLKLGTAVAEAVVGHLLQKGLIRYGALNEFLG